MITQRSYIARYNTRIEDNLRIYIDVNAWPACNSDFPTFADVKLISVSLLAVIFQCTEGQGRNSPQPTVFAYGCPGRARSFAHTTTGLARYRIVCRQFVRPLWADSFIRAYGTLIYDKYLLNFEMMNFRILMLIS